MTVGSLPLYIRADDRRPANILLSNENVPVLVDFGFAEKYDLQSPEAFHSNLSYGTPEVRCFSLLYTLSHHSQLASPPFRSRARIHASLRVPGY